MATPAEAEVCIFLALEETILKSELSHLPFLEPASCFGVYSSPFYHSNTRCPLFSGPGPSSRA